MTNINIDPKAIEEKLKAATEKSRTVSHIPPGTVPGQQLAAKNPPPIPDPRSPRQ